MKPTYITLKYQDSSGKTMASGEAELLEASGNSVTIRMKGIVRECPKPIYFNPDSQQLRQTESGGLELILPHHMRSF